MSVVPTTGVVALSKIMIRLGQGALTVDQLATEQGIARTTAFDVVRKLADAQFVRRGMDGKVSLGPAAEALGFAAYGLAPLCGPAAALLDWLHEGTGASVELVGGDTVLLRRGKPLVEATMEAPVLDDTGAVRARLRLGWCATTNRAERQAISARFERTVLSLQHYMMREGVSHG